VELEVGSLGKGLVELEVGSLGSSKQPEDRDHSPLDWQVTVVAEPV